VFSWEYNTPQVRTAVEQLPPEAREALSAFLYAVVFDPVDYGRAVDEAVGKAVRTLPFGAQARGLVTFQIYEPDRLVLVLRTQWFG
jgi:hypothetical protein